MTVILVSTFILIVVARKMHCYSSSSILLTHTVARIRSLQFACVCALAHWPQLLFICTALPRDVCPPKREDKPSPGAVATLLSFAANIYDPKYVAMCVASGVRTHIYQT